jgi:hypothetical protein
MNNNTNHILQLETAILQLDKITKQQHTRIHQLETAIRTALDTCNCCDPHGYTCTPCTTLHKALTPEAYQITKTQDDELPLPPTTIDTQEPAIVGNTKHWPPPCPWCGTTTTNRNCKLPTPQPSCPTTQDPNLLTDHWTGTKTRIGTPLSKQENPPNPETSRQQDN